MRRSQRGRPWLTSRVCTQATKDRQRLSTDTWWWWWWNGVGWRRGAGGRGGGEGREGGHFSRFFPLLGSLRGILDSVQVLSTHRAILGCDHFWLKFWGQKQAEFGRCPRLARGHGSSRGPAGREGPRHPLGQSLSSCKPSVGTFCVPSTLMDNIPHVSDLQSAWLLLLLCAASRPNSLLVRASWMMRSCEKRIRHSCRLRSGPRGTTAARPRRPPTSARLLCRGKCQGRELQQRPPAKESPR